jgi:hypothetical protein
LTAFPELALAVSADQAGGGVLTDRSTDGDEQAAVASAAIQINTITGYLMVRSPIVAPNQNSLESKAYRVNNKLPNEHTSLFRVVSI